MSWNEKLLRRLLPEDRTEEVLGDLAELRQIREARTDEREAARWYRRQVRGFTVRLLALRLLGRSSELEEERADARFDVLHGSVPGARSGWSETLSTLARDLRFALRTLGRTPGYTAAVVVTLGLGIGANTAIFSVINGVLLKPLPYGEGDDLVFLRQPELNGNQENTFFSVRDIEDLRDRNRSLVDVAEYHSMSFILHGRGDAEMVTTGVVSADFFDLMGMEPALGRDFTEADDRLGAEPVLMLSYGYWQTRFGGDPEIVGEGMVMNGHTHTVIGVLPPIPQHPRENDVYMTTASCPTRSGEGFIANRSARMMSVFARMRPGMALEDAQRDVEAVAAELGLEHPDHYARDLGQTFQASLLREELVQNARPTLLLLFGTAGLVLLIACANVANLTLARTSRRSQELAVRMALGSGRRRLARQLWTESAVLGLAGGVVGLGVAWGGMDLLVAFASRFTPRAEEAGLSVSVLGFALVASLFTALLFGSAPVLTLRSGMAEALRESGKNSAGRGRWRLQNGLVVAQFALAFSLLTGAGLALRSFWELAKVDPGFDVENVLTFQVAPWGSADVNSAFDQKLFLYELQDRVRVLPGVQQAGISDLGPLAPGFTMRHGVRIEEETEMDGRRMPQAQPRVASAGYFDASGIPLRAGRAFRRSDDLEVPHVAIVNEAFARDVLGLLETEIPRAIGRRFTPCTMNGQCEGEEIPTVEVVGVVGDVRVGGIEEEPPAQFYRPSGQNGWPGGRLVVRTRNDPLALVDAVRRTVKDLDSQVPVYSVSSLEDIRQDSMAPRRLTMILLLLFAGVAFSVSLAGIAGVIAFTVSQRTHEIGIRIALGADRGKVLAGVMGQGMVLILGGLGLGVLGGVGVGRALSGGLWGVSPTDPLTFGLSAVVLCALGALACYVPGRRATRIDPVEAFRSS
jgi:predicted permease